MRRVLVLLLPGVHLLDLAGPVQVCHSANEQGADYALTFCACQPQVPSAQGLTLADLSPLPEIQPGDLILVPGVQVGPAQHLPTLLPPEASDWLRGSAQRGAEVAAVCAGAFALGEAGLLAGRRCTTHWSLTSLLQMRYPGARVLEGVLFVHDRGVTTSAGIASGTDLALSLVEQHHGPLLTARVARDLVVYMRRGGEHAQVSIYLEYRTHLHAGVHRVQDYITQHPAERATLADLGRVAGLSERHLARTDRQECAGRRRSGRRRAVQGRGTEALPAGLP
ncbi:DJ-1/PfpI family protein (plasmid) [Deinococcus radiomollis]|uniref:GlxA family transcriptional regulator n=1 Tax=Deinococcus radiomollis TaxID=468916 RepID=UPI00389212B2